MSSIVDKEKIAATQVSFTPLIPGVHDTNAPDPIELLAMEVPSDTDTESYHWLGGVPGFAEWKDERKLSGLRAEGFSVRNRDWASGIRISRNEITDDKLGVVRPRIEMLAQKAKQHKPKLLVETLLNSFSGADPEIGTGLAYDGAFFFSPDHQEGAGPTQSNLTNRILSTEAFEEAWQTMAELVDEGGDPLDVQPTHLLVGPKNRGKARRLLNAELINEGGAAVSNIYAGSVQLLVSPRIRGASDDYWFLLDLSQPVRPLIFQSREGITFGAVDDLASDAVFMRKEFKYGAQARYAVALGLWQCALGSTGEVA
jgi:phage major head subunit gpT-like protein